MAAIRDVISVETIDEGEPIRAIDALYVVSQLEERCGHTGEGRVLREGAVLLDHSIRGL